MKQAFSLLAVGLLAGALSAQQYNDDGEILGANGGPGGNAPGNLLQTLTGPSTSHKDLAHDGQYLMTLTGTSSVTLIDDATGAIAGTINGLVTTSDFGIAWDDKREYIIISNASTDVVYVYDRTGALVTSWPFPSTGHVGVAWDCRRDVYWVIDWSFNTVWSIDPNTGLPTGTSWSTSAIGCTRGAGLGYDANTDTLYFGGRDQRTVFGMDAATGGLVCSFLCDQGSSNNPPGVAISPRGGVWCSRYSNASLDEWEGCTPTHPEMRLSPNFPTAGNALTLTLSRLNPGERCLIGYSLAGCGPTATPLGAVLLSPPWTVIGPNSANGAGVFSLSTNVPGALAGRTLYLHGGGLGGSGLSNNAIINP